MGISLIELRMLPRCVTTKFARCTFMLERGISTTCNLVICIFLRSSTINYRTTEKEIDNICRMDDQRFTQLQVAKESFPRVNCELLGEIREQVSISVRNDL